MKTWAPGEDVFAADINSISHEFFGDGSDGDVVISVNTSLEKDMFYNNLTVNTGITLNSNGFKIYIKGSVNTIGTGKIISNGGNGGNGGDGQYGDGSYAPSAPGGIAGVIPYTTGTLPLALAGVVGAASPYSNSNGNVGAPGVSVAKTLSTNNSVAGGRGGNEVLYSKPGGVGGALATITGTLLSRPFSAFSYANLFDMINGVIYAWSIAPSSGSGGSGASLFNGTTSRSGGGGGGSGSTGGFVWICVFNIINLNVEAKGGNGGNGGDGNDGYGGRNTGGGGSGGNGGIIIIIRKFKTTITYSVAGGLAGTTPSTANGATNGNAGNVGVYKEIEA